MNNSVVVPYEHFKTRRLMVETNKLIFSLAQDIKNCEALARALDSIADQCDPRDAKTSLMLSRLYMSIEDMQTEFSMILLNAVFANAALVGMINRSEESAD